MLYLCLCFNENSEVYYDSYFYIIPPLGHSDVVTIEGKKATCEESGLTVGEYCLNCNKTICTQQTIPALGHNDVDGVCSNCEEFIEYKIEFIVDGEVYKTIPFTIYTMNAVTAPVVPNKKGYTGVWSAFDIKNENITVEAIYTPNTYIITYVLNGGKNHENNPHKYTYGDNILLQSPTINEKFAIFGGWFTDSNYIADATITSITSTMAGDITLYAQWIYYRIESATGFEINYDSSLPTLTIRVSNSTERFDFRGKIKVSKNCTWSVYKDEYASNSYDARIVPLELGENTFYIMVFHPNSEYFTQYIVKIHRNRMFNVSFDEQNGTAVADQVIEEGYFATAPETTRLGYTFDSWDYDFSKPIVSDTEITASWIPNDDTKYTVEYYLQNLENDKYTLFESVVLTGITDTTAYGETNRYEHFTYNASLGKSSGNIDGTGNSVLSVYYTRNIYTLSVNDTSYGTITNSGGYKYGSEEIASTVTANLGYEFIGWYNGETLLSTDLTYTFTATQNVTAKFEVKEEMANFNFTSTTTTCDITGIKDKDVTEIVVPNYVTSIGDQAFEVCYGLTSLVIGDSVTLIGNRAFWQCYRLTSVVIGDSVTSIGDLAFDACYKLVEVINKSSHITVTKGSEYNGGVGYYAISVSNRDASYVSKVTTDENGYITYVNGSDVILVDYIGSETNLVLPLNITKINQYAFWHYTSLTSVEIQNSVTEIGNHAFDGCSGLTSVVIGDSVTSIGSYAFYNCSGLTSVEIPNSVTSIGSYAFRDCSGLTEITLPFVGATKDGTSNTHFGYIFGASSNNNNSYVPSSIKKVTITGGSIGSSAFYSCDSLTSVVIGDSVTSIGSYAFNGCSSLTSVVIGDSVTSIGSNAFRNCSGLTEITLPFVGATKDGTSNTYLGYIFGASSYNNNNSYVPSSIKKVTITGGSIGSNAFRNCSGLTSVVIGDSVTSIGSYAFYDCDSLTSVVIGDSVTSIGILAFEDCSSLTSVVIPDSVTSIGNSAFGFCTSLTSVVIGDGVTSIGSYAFYDCYKLVEVINKSPYITLTKGYTSNGHIGYYALSVSNCNDNYISKLSNDNGFIIYTDGGERILVGYAGKETNLVLPNYITKINQYAFRDCSSLTSVVIPNSVTEIGYGAFSGCSKLTEITLPFIGATKDGTNNTHFGYIFGASYYSENSSYVPSSLKKVTITGGSSIRNDAFYGCSGLTSVVIPNSVMSIGSYAFYDCDGLTSIEIPNSVMSIGSYAFYGCSSLTSVVIGDSVTSIGYGAFNGCSSLRCNVKDNLKYLGNEDNPYLYLADVTSEDITSANIDSACKFIGSYAFKDCDSLTSVVIGDSVTSIGIRAFEDCDSLTSVVIGDSVTSIGDSAFEDCTNLTSVVIGDSVTSIGDSAFYSCRSLTSVVIGDSVTSIGYRAFYGCSGLTSVVIGDSVTSIGNYAFYSCDRLTKVYYKGTACDWSKISTGGYNTNLTNTMRYYYSETEPTLNVNGTAYDGNYWRYVDGVATPWVYVKPEE